MTIWLYGYMAMYVGPLGSIWRWIVSIDTLYTNLKHQGFQILKNFKEFKTSGFLKFKNPGFFKFKNQGLLKFKTPGLLNFKKFKTRGLSNFKEFKEF